MGLAKGMMTAMADLGDRGLLPEPNITLNVAEVIEAYAQSVGKDADQLEKSEQMLALRTAMTAAAGKFWQSHPA